LRADASLSDRIRDVQAGASKFMQKKRWVAGRFSWQEGFGGFSDSRSQLGAVMQYIQSQQNHNAKKSFREEYIELPERSSAAYDPRYVFKTGRSAFQRCRPAGA
jgi:hypothetical protein